MTILRAREHLTLPSYPLVGYRGNAKNGALYFPHRGSEFPPL